MTAQVQYAPYDFVLDPGTFLLERHVIPSVLGPLDIYATTRCKASALILIHGLNGSWQSWTPLLTYAARHSHVLDNHDLIVLDMRRLLTPISLEDLGILGGVIRQFVEHEVVHLFGHSSGGSLALAMTADQPDRVRSVRLVSGAFVALCEEVRTRRPHPLAANTTRRAIGQFRVFARLGPLVPLVLATAARFKLLAKLASGMYYDSAGLPPRILESIRLNYSGRTLRRTIAMGRSYPFAEIYPRVSVPVISVAGAADPLVDPRDVDRLARLFIQFDPTTIPGAGHFAHIERPDAVGAILFRGL